MSTNYKAVTPCGAFEATWGEDEESRVEYSGSADAIEYFRAFLDFNSVTGSGGAIIRFDKLEPADLYGFCQSKEYGISVLPNEDDLKEESQGDEMEMTLMDAVSPAEAFELTGEGAQILMRLDESADTFFADFDRMRVIVTELGDAADDPAAPARAYLQAVIDGPGLSEPMLADELGKIHAAHGADAGMLALFKSAVTAYANHVIAQAADALKG
jgi:hypothetical protein